MERSIQEDPDVIRPMNEIIGGVTNFFLVAYIIVVNAAILSDAGMPKEGVMAATVISTALMTLAMGVIGRLPYVVAPGMGINAFFAYSLCGARGIPWETALGIVFWSGVIFMAILPIREKIVRAIPDSLRLAAAVGIGFFLAVIGLQKGALLAAHPATMVTSAKFGPENMLCLIGVAVILIFYSLRWKIQGKDIAILRPISFLCGMAVVTGLSLYYGLTKVPENFVTMPDLNSVFMKVDFVGSLSWGFVSAMVALLFTDLFDSMSTFVGVARSANLMEDGQPKNLGRGLFVDALATLVAGPIGTSSLTTFAESAGGVEAGARTGWSSVVTAICFVPCLFFVPVLGMVPDFASASVLLVVGALMVRSVTQLDANKIEEFIPAFVTFTLIPWTYSITDGLLWGFIAHSLMFVFVGRAKEVRPLMWLLSGLALSLLFLKHGEVYFPAVIEFFQSSEVG